MVKVEYFYNVACTHCPAARALVREVVSRNPGIEYVEVNTYSEAGIRRGMALKLMAIPAVAVNNEVKLIGWPFEAADLQKCIDEAQA